MGEPSSLPTLLLEGVGLMGIGMGIVFAFLLLLVALLHLLSAGVRRFGPKAPAEGPEDERAVLIAVLSAAIHRYRRERGHPTP